MEFNPLAVIVLLLVCVIGLVLALSMLRLPVLPAYFIAGVAAGPHGLGLIDAGEEVSFLAEIGVIFLLFTIGLKFNRKMLYAMRREILVLGALEMGLVMAVIGGLFWWFTKDAFLSFLAASIGAMSSTAIVSEILVKGRSVVSPVGRRAMAILLFQDIAVIPLIIIMSSPASADTVLPTAALIVVKIIIVLVIALIIGPPIMAGWLNFISRHGEKELFILSLVAIIAVAAKVSSFFGLSHELGAFLAGMVIAETLHRHRVERIIEPFQQLFLGFFFVSLGLLIHPALLGENWRPVLGLTAALILIKAPLLYACLRLASRTFKTTAMSVTLLLTGAGEFGFVLLTVAIDSGRVADEDFQILLSANLLSLVAIPFLWATRERWSRWLTAGDKPDDKKMNNLKKVANIKDHIIICGFGRTGQTIAGILRTASIPYIALEDDYLVLRAVGGVDNVIYGESERPDSLLKAGIMEARVLIVSYDDETGSFNAVRAARKLNPDLLIIAKADTVLQAKQLMELGADDALIQARECGFSLARLSLQKSPLGGSSSLWISKAIDHARKFKNPFLLGGYGSRSQSEFCDTQYVGCVVDDSFAGKPLADILQEAEVVSWLRKDAILDKEDGARLLQSGDELILAGDAEKINQLQELIEGKETEADD